MWMNRFLGVTIFTAICIFFSTQLSVAAQTESEPNDSIEEADLIELFEKVDGIASSNEDDDYFQINISEKGMLEISFPQTNSVDFNFRVRKAGTPVIDWAYSRSSNGHFQYGVDKGTYYIHVIGVNQKDKSSENPYSFTATFSKTEYFEAEYNSEIGYANPSKPNVSYRGNGNEEDYFVIQGLANKMLNITVSSGNAALYRADGTLVDYSITTPEKHIDYPTDDELYYLKIKSEDYSFFYSFQDRAENYEAEFNNSQQLANSIHFNQDYFGQVDTYFDIDFYQFEVKTSGLVTIDLNSFGNANYKLTVYDEKGNRISEGRTDRLSNEMLVIGLTRGTYTFSVELLLSVQVNQLYTFQISSDTSKLYDLEKNNDMKIAQELPLNTKLYGKGYDRLDSHDYYQVKVNENGLLKVELEASEVTFFQVTIFSEDGETMEYVQMGKNEKNILKTGVPAGTYFIEIVSFSPSKEFYTITATLTPSDRYEFEINNDKENASILTFNQYKNGQIDYNADADWYTFTLLKSTLTTLKFPNQIRESYNVVLYDQNGNKITQFYSGHDGGYIETFEAQLKKGTYFVEVTRKYGEVNSDYQLSINISTITSFTDVPMNHKYYKEISLIREMGIINGYPDGKYGLKEEIKRQHVAAMLVRSGVKGLPEYPKFAFTFPDVPFDTHPNVVNIQKLVEAGIFDANPKGFYPDEPLTRAQLAKILVKAYDLKLNPDNQHGFKDVNKGDWYHDYVQILASNNITIGYNGYFKPNDPVTREHFAIFLYRTL